MAAVLLGGILSLPVESFASVTDVILTGLPPNTTISLTNEETKEKVEQKTDERGFVVIPMTGKKWQSGRHSVTCQVEGKTVTSRVFLRDGANRVDLTSLTYSARPLDPTKAKTVDEALKKSSAALKADPKNSQALLTQGSALNRLGRNGEALSNLAQAAKLGSTHPALAFETGWSLMKLGMYPEAIAQLEKYEKMNPGLGQTSEFIGRSHLYMGEMDKADAKFKEAIQRDPRLASTVRFHQAVLETLRKNPEAASNHIRTLLKEAPNSPTAQIFKNALLQAPGAKPAGAGAKDYKLSDPIKIQLPPTTAGDVAGAVAKGVVGGLLGGLFGGGGREPEGPKLAAKPALPETTLASKDGKTKINLSGAIEDGKPYIVMGVKESPGNGAPHLILLQDKNCNVLQPKETSVTGIWEQWGGWKLTVSWTKSYYQDGQLVKQEKGGWSTPWNIFRTQIKDPSEIPGIWKDFGGKPFEGTREVMSSFETPPGVQFNPADWNLVTHATTDAGNNQILTAPFVTGLATDKDNNLVFKPMDHTACESTPPTAPLLANNPVTFPWTVGPYALTMTPTPDPKDTHKQEFLGGVEFEVARSVSLSVRYIHRSIPSVVADVGQPRPVLPEKTKTPVRPKGDKVETRPDGSATTTQINPDGSTIRTRRSPDGSTTTTRTDPRGFTDTTTTHPDGSTTTTRTSGGPGIIRTQTNPDGSTSETGKGRTAPRDPAATFPDGSTHKVQRNPDGSTTTTLPDGSTSTTGWRNDDTNTLITTRTNADGSAGPTSTTRNEVGGSVSTWTQTNSDGSTTTETRRTSGSGGSNVHTVTTYPDGFRHEVLSGGGGYSTATTTFPDGSTTRIIAQPTSTRVTTTSSDGSTHEVFTADDGSMTTTQTNPDGSGTTTGRKADGTTYTSTTNPDGTTTTTRTNADGSTTTTQEYPDGSRQTRTTFRDGSSVEMDRKGGITFHDAPTGAQTPPQPADSPAPPSILDSIDEKIVIS